MPGRPFAATAPVTRVYRFFEHRSPAFIHGAALLFVAVLGIANYLIGAEVSFSVFYLMPVSLAAWFAGRRAGILVSVFSAGVWLWAIQQAGMPVSHPAIPYWNMTVRLGFFVVDAVLLAALRDALGRERALARTDPLTGVSNRLAFLERAEAELRRARRYGHSFTVAFLDADNFKAVNDTAGHETGDRLLRTAGSVLRSNLRGVDTVARMGGDEFAVLLPETGHEQARTALSKVREELLATMAANGWPVTFSVGAVVCLAQAATLDQVMRQADELMYRVKKGGRNDVVLGLLNEPLAGAPPPRDGP